MSFTKEPAYTGSVHVGCLNCHPHTERIASMDTCIFGYGWVNIQKDGVVIYEGGMSDPGDEEDIPRLASFESMAAADPDHDWRYTNYTPLHGEVYQRHGPEMWVLIESNMGFA